MRWSSRRRGWPCPEDRGGILARFRAARIVINSESSHLQYVVRRYRTTQTLKRQFAYWLRRRPLIDRCAHSAIDQDLTVAGLRAETGREIDHGPGRAVLGATLETDRAERRIFGDSSSSLSEIR
jgi:hypothetical protein